MPEYDPTGSRCSGVAQPGTTNLLHLIFNKFPGGANYGIYNCRSTRGGSRLSEHGEGRALDYGLAASNGRQRAIGDALVSWLVENAEPLGVQSVIWNRRVWGYGRWEWRVYNGSNPHTDHVHVGQNWRGAKYLNQYGKIDPQHRDTGEEDWFDMATKDELREVVREELANEDGPVFKGLFEKRPNQQGEKEVFEAIDIVERKVGKILEHLGLPNTPTGY